MATYKYLDDNGLLYYHQKLMTAVANQYVAKVTGKGLSTNDFTTAEQTKLAGIASGAEVNIINAITLNGVSATITNKTAALTLAVPTKTSDLTNDSGFQNATQVQTAINSAIAGITGISFEVVTTLPATGQTGVIYLVSHGGTSPEIYDEYIWLATTSTYEKIGTTDVDLSGYVQATEMVTITNAEIDTILAS